MNVYESNPDGEGMNRGLRGQHRMETLPRELRRNPSLLSVQTFNHDVSQMWLKDYLDGIVHRQDIKICQIWGYLLATGVGRSLATEH